MLKHINGSWFEFWHHNLPEGKYMNPVCRYFSAEQWAAKVEEMHSLRMKYIVLTCSALIYDDYGEAYFDTDVLPFAKDMTCKDPIEVMLNAADKYDMRVFMSAGFYGNWTHTLENMTSPVVTARAYRAMEQLHAKYGAHKSFYGWYFPDETCIEPYFLPEFSAYVNAYSAFVRSLSASYKTLIAPYGTNLLKADDTYVAQLEALDVDFVAYQDEIGVRKSLPEQTWAYYAALRRAHDKAGRSRLWADMELFKFEGDVYKSALIPTDIERVKRQLESISEHVDEILCYEYLGVMNKPGTIAYCGHPDSVAYYSAYRELLETLE